MRGRRYESADSPTDINRREMLETEKSGANLVAFMPDHTKDFSDFAHRCVCAFAVVGVNRAYRNLRFRTGRGAIPQAHDLRISQ